MPSKKDERPSPPAPALGDKQKPRATQTVPGHARATGRMPALGDVPPPRTGGPFPAISDVPTERHRRLESEGPLRDLYEDSQVTLDPLVQERMREAAPEISQGKFRDRAYVPRPVLPKETVLAALEQELQLVQMRQEDVALSVQSIKKGWLPYLRQVVEQAGGTGLDARIVTALARPRPPTADSPVLEELVSKVRGLERCASIAELLGEARAVLPYVDQVLSSADRRKLSLRSLERDLDGRLDLDVVLGLLLSSDAELKERLEQVKSSLETFRSQMRANAGVQPNGMLWNFSRAKAERILIEAELKLRGVPL